MVDGYGKALIRILRKHGWKLLRPGKGDHEIWLSPDGERKVAIDRGTRSRYTALAILKDAGIDERI